LLLAAGQGGASLNHHGVLAVAKTLDELVGVGRVS
jgi:hypothetical protein